MSGALPGANFEVGAAIPGDVNLNSRPGVNTFEFFRSFFREMQIAQFVAWPGATQVVTGTGSTTVNEDQVYSATGATHASTAGRYRVAMLKGTGAAYGINWGKKFFVAFNFMWEGTSATNLTMRMHITQATTIINLAAHGLGLQTNGANINLATYGTGGAQQLVSAATDLVTSDRVFILIEHDPAVADRLYINGVLKATQSTAADIPSTEPASNYNFFASISRSGGVGTTNESLAVENIIYGQKL